MPADPIEQAKRLFEEAWEAQKEEDFDRAADLYQKSLSLHPTAEAHTFLGWTFHLQGKVQEAIEQCKRAIEIDPDFGNPYNDIGAYLIGMGRYDDAIPWLERAIIAKRYEPRHYPYFNLGRVYLAKGHLRRAKEFFQKSLETEPGYTAARDAVEILRRMMN